VNACYPIKHKDAIGEECPGTWSEIGNLLDASDTKTNNLPQ
jgi:hypothetical protein